MGGRDSLSGQRWWGSMLLGTAGGRSQQAGRALRFRLGAGSGWRGGRSLRTGGLSVWGARPLDSRRGPREPRVQGSGGFWPTGEARGGSLTPGWNAEGLVSQGVCLCLCPNLGRVCLWLSSWGGLFVAAAGPGLSPLAAGSALLDMGVRRLSLWAQGLPGEKAGPSPEPQSQRRGQRGLSCLVISTDGQHHSVSSCAPPSAAQKAHSPVKTLSPVVTKTWSL